VTRPKKRVGNPLGESKLSIDEQACWAEMPILQHMGSAKVFKRNYLNEQFRARAWSWFHRFRG
jgi:hypothetical protein